METVNAKGRSDVSAYTDHPFRLLETRRRNQQKPTRALSKEESKRAVGGHRVISSRNCGLVATIQRRPVMTIPRRHLLNLALSVAILPVVSRIATAQSYPTRPERLMVGP